MPGIELIKLTIRTGTEAQRRRVLLEQGELAYISDAKRLFIGDGLLSGGNPSGSIIHQPLEISGARTTLTTAYKGDIVNELGLMWQLTAADPTALSAWANISTRVNNSSIEYDPINQLRLKDNGITGTKFASTAGSGGIIATSANGLSANPDNITIGVLANKISLLPAGVTETYIASTALSSGLVGGSGTKLRIQYDPTVFYIAGNSLALSALPLNIVTFGSINSSVIGAGLIYDPTTSTIRSNIASVDTTLTALSGVVGLAPVAAGATAPLATIVYDNYGRVINGYSSVQTTFALSAKSTSPGFAYLSAYNGYPGQTVSGALSGVPLTMFQVISSNATNTSSVFITLSSAGFAALPSNVAQDGKVNSRFAVPVFTY
jgi:hypothetical protein